ncbi:hypothetical protein A4X09_0g5866 [Tilletia walkeri]|uniref:Uncharacterized protein n=1 Tax=Tilletia walkeri TaxID=117179 RepID=A0A8X7N6E9_9BASI|nr:hypothetical protein A4X09_0g5866 [Tilletia walkeri]
MIGIAQPPPTTPAYPTYTPSLAGSTINSRTTAAAGNTPRVSWIKDERDESKRQKRAAKANKKDPIHGDNLTPMPMTPASQHEQARQRNSLPPGSRSLMADENIDDKYTTIPRRRSEPPAMTAEKSDYGLSLANDVLVERERLRIAAAPTKAFIARRRMWAGIPTLLMLAPSTYCLAKSCTAWLALSPATVLFSDAREGTTASPDPTARILAMLTICTGAVSIALNLMAIIYLRVSRQRRRLGRAFVWTCALATIVLQTGMAILNLLLIFFWHKTYSKTPSSPFASTRDVALRCQGTWEFDILYTAAQYSALSESSSKVAACTKGGLGTLRDYLIVGGVRIGIFVAIGTWWLIVVTRYNRSLAAAMPSPFATEPKPDASDMPESAELHRLLEEEKLDLESRIPGAWEARTQTHHPSYPYGKAYAEFEETVVVVTEPDDGGEVTVERIPAVTSSWTEPKYEQYNHQQQYANGPAQMPMPIPGGPSPSGFLAPPAPKLSRFDWQRGEASTSEVPPGGAPSQTFNNVPNEFGQSHGHGNRDGSGSFTTWASSLVTSVFSTALSYASPQVPTTHQQPVHQNVRQQQVPYASVNMTDDDFDDIERQKALFAAGPKAYDPPQTVHDRGPSKLGISSWFGGGARRSTSATRGTTATGPTVMRNLPHDDSESESGMGNGGGYASSRTSMSDVKGDGYGDWSQRNFAGLAAMDQQRSSLRSSKVGTPVTHLPNHAHVAHGTVPSGRRFSTDSQGDELPHMPELKAVPRKQGSASGRSSSGRAIPGPPPAAPLWRPSDQNSHQQQPRQAQASSSTNGNSSTDSADDGQFWVVDHMRMISSNDASGDLLPPRPEAPTFVRQLGQLVRKLSAIESVGSAGERERSSSGSGISYAFHGGNSQLGGGSGSGSGGGLSARTGRRSSASGGARMGSVEEEAVHGGGLGDGLAEAEGMAMAAQDRRGSTLAVPGQQQQSAGASQGGHHQQYSSGSQPPALPGRWKW